MIAWYHHQTIFVAQYDVVAFNPHTPDDNRQIIGLYAYPVLAAATVGSQRKQRILPSAGAHRVAASAVDHGAHNAALAGTAGHRFIPNAAFEAATVIECDHITCRYVIDVVANVAIRRASIWRTAW